jgi:hypothetical protein
MAIIFHAARRTKRPSVYFRPNFGRYRGTNSILGFTDFVLPTLNLVSDTGCQLHFGVNAKWADTQTQTESVCLCQCVSVCVLSASGSVVLWVCQSMGLCVCGPAVCVVCGAAVCECVFVGQLCVSVCCVRPVVLTVPLKIREARMFDSPKFKAP